MTKHKRELSVEEAKANFTAAMCEIHPLKSVMERPFMTVGVAAATGMLSSYVGLRFMSSLLMIPARFLAIFRKLL